MLSEVERYATSTSIAINTEDRALQQEIIILSLLKEAYKSVKLDHKQERGKEKEEKLNLGILNWSELST